MKEFDILEKVDPERVLKYIGAHLQDSWEQQGLNIGDFVEGRVSFPLGTSPNPEFAGKLPFSLEGELGERRAGFVYVEKNHDHNGHYGESIVLVVNRPIVISGGRVLPKSQIEISTGIPRHDEVAFPHRHDRHKGFSGFFREAYFILDSITAAIRQEEPFMHPTDFSYLLPTREFLKA